MESANNLISDIANIKERYDRLLNRFNEFVAQILAVKGEDVRFNDIEIIDKGDNSINIRYLDRELIARFTFFINADGNRKGYVTCYKVSGYPKPEPIIIHSFNFTAQGETDLPPNNEGDPYELQDRVDAVNILLHWVRLSVNEDS